MIYGIYLILVLLELILLALNYLLVLVIPIFSSPQFGYLDNASTKGVGPRLPKWLSWYQTVDNSLYGDQGFRLINGTSYLSMVKWLIRNPIPSFGAKTCYSRDALVTGNNEVTDERGAGVAGWVFVRSTGLFQFVWIYKLSSSKCIYVNLGWNLRALTRGAELPYVATFSFSPRLSSF